MLQEFDISITAVGNDRYLVRTEQVAPGVPLAQEQFHWPIDDWLAEASALMHDPLLGILKGDSSQRWAAKSSYRSGGDAENSEPMPTFVSLGQALYNSLFDRTLRDSWLTAQGVAQNRRSPLRLRVGLRGEKLQKLPWEVLHAGDRPLGTGTDVTFSRYHLERRQGYDRPGATVPDFDTPLRVLMVIAAPNDQDRLELAREAKHLKQELHPVSMRSGGDYDFLPKQQLDVQLTVLEQPGRAELTQALEQGNYQVLHYAGHSNLGNAGGDLYLVSRQTGLTERISGEDLAGLLSNNGVKLAVFNSCRGAYAQGGSSELGWHEQNLAHALVNRGVPGVIAMAERIPDDVAITFTQLLYRNLKQGNPIDLCLNRTRQGLISAHGSHYSYWALPILYMQPGFDGYLASKPGESNTALDKLLSESESALAALEEPAVEGDVKSAISSAEELSPDHADLDDIVETMGLDDIQSYNEDDAETVKELVNQLSQPSQQEDVIPASADEPLIPDTLETPGLDLYDQLPKKPVPPSPAEEDTDIPQSGIYETYEPDATAETAAPTYRSGESNPQPTTTASRRPQQVALGVGAAAILGLAGISIGNTMNWGGNGAPQSSNTTEVSSDLTLSEGIDSGDPKVVAASLTTKLAEQGPKPTLNYVPSPNEETDGETAPTKAFARGQLMWNAMTQEPGFKGGDQGFTADNAMRSWEQALEIKPNWFAAQVALGFAYYELGELDEAIKTWEAAVKNHRNQDNIPIVTIQSDGQPENLANAPTKLHAHMGLAMAHYAHSEIQVPEEDAQKIRSYAEDAWNNAEDSAVAEGITLEDVIAYHWLWSSKAAADWVEVNEALSGE